MLYEEQWERLNEYQKEAVLDESPACVVNANVGSGKTTVLIAKILYLYIKKKVPVRSMTVLTFTNKAAGEIRERLLKIEPGLTDEELAGFGTFHSVAMNFLRTRLNIEKYGRTKDFMIIEPDEEAELALRLAREEKLNIKYKNRLKKRMEQEYAAFCRGKEESRYKDDLFVLFQVLQEEKKRQNKMSFTDLIEVSTELLKEETWKPDWIIVDEVQDSDRKQIEFISALKGDQTRLFAVGDPNQLIYSWRGSVETMFYYLKHQFEAKELSLPVNYRSSGMILEAAEKFLQYGNTVTGNREEGSPILVKNHYDAFQEASYLAQKIRELNETGMDYGEIAVFYRLQSQSEILEKVFGKEGIPYTVSLKKTLRDIPVLEWFVKVLTFACNPNDMYAAEAALSHPSYGEGPKKTNWKHFLTAPEEGRSLLYDRMHEFMQIFSAGQIPEPEEIYRYFLLDTYLRPNASSYEEDRNLVLHFCQRLTGYSRENHRNLSEGTADFLRSSSLYGIQILKEYENPGRDKVRLMTLHASKGLEFAYVFIIGVNDGLLPLAGRGFEEEEEERRLFFVGMTRARDHLELSYYTNPGQPRTAGGPGRYLNMLPRHLLDWEGNKTPEERQASLQQLRKAVREEREHISAVNDTFHGQKDTLPDESTVKTKKPDIPEEVGSVRKARHAKYGTGILISENEMTVEVEFEGYGKKEFLKAFGEIEISDS